MMGTLVSGTEPGGHGNAGERPRSAYDESSGDGEKRMDLRDIYKVKVTGLDDRWTGG